MLKRSIVDKKTVNNQLTLHKLTLSDDTIDSYGSDVVVGDSLTLFVQSDRVGVDGFSWNSNYYKTTSVDLSTLDGARTDAITDHIDKVLVKTGGLSNKDITSLGFTDVPFELSACNDDIRLYEADNVGVGDFAFLGVVTSEQDVTSGQVQAELTDYIESIEELRMPPSVASFFQTFTIYREDLTPYNERYDGKDYPEPLVHGDTMSGNSIENAIFGEFLSVFSFNQHGGAAFAVDDRADAYVQYQNAQYNIEYADDTISAKTGTEDIDPQKNNEKITYNSRKLEQTNDNNYGVTKTAVGKMLFTEHPLLVQFVDDHWNKGIYSSDLVVWKGDVCYESTQQFVHFIPQAPENPEAIFGDQVVNEA